MQHKRREIYRYTDSVNQTLYASSWSNKVYADKKFRMIVGTLLDGEGLSNNKVYLIELDENIGELIMKASHAHDYPASAMQFVPNADEAQPDLFASTSSYLKIFRFQSENGNIKLECELNSNKSNLYSSPLTNMDWNEIDVSLIGTSSIDTTVCVWNIEVSKVVGFIPSQIKGNIKTQLIAHESQVHDISFTRLNNGRDNFATCGSDGSIRLFDLRSLQHSTILYEDPEKRALNVVKWNKLDPTKLATVESTEVIILDVRMPCRVLTKFSNNQNINGIAWAPHSHSHICTAGSDKQALIWQMNSFKRDEQPILAYTADGEISNINWANNFNQWICIVFGPNLEILRV